MDAAVTPVIAVTAVPLVVRLRDVTDSSVVGGKARALANMGRAGLPVPAWCVVTADAFADGLSPDQRALLAERIEADAPTAAAIAARVDATRTLVREAPLSPRFQAELAAALAELSPAGEPVAVRSSASDEDGAAHSFAGQLESYLFVPPADVEARVRDVWQSGLSDRLVQYRRQHALSLPPRLPAVIVQRMVRPRAAGVAFAADPVSGRRGVAIVSAVLGVGTGLVSGEGDADTWHVDRTGTIVARTIAHKTTKHEAPADGGAHLDADADAAIGVRVDAGANANAGTATGGGGGARGDHEADANADTAGADGVRRVAVSDAEARAPALTDREVAAVAALARDASRHAGRPQDIEWALEDDRLFLLQSRPITTLSALADPDATLAIWDNSNIVESYSGVTTPLTFSFASEIYQGVYRQFCRLMGVSPRVLAEEDDTFRNMLGLIRGRLYYNLLNWYRVLALLPGFTVNRRFMEQMMGVRESLPASVTAAIAPRRGHKTRGGDTGRSARHMDGQAAKQPGTQPGAQPGAQPEAQPGAQTSGPQDDDAGGDTIAKLRDAVALGGTIAGLIVNYVRLPRQIARFTVRLDEALGPAAMPLAVPLSEMRPDELAGYYRDLRRKLLTRWDAPLVNDFFAMIFYGVLRQLTARWCHDTEGTLQNDLVGGEGGMVSAEPAQRLQAMARLAAAHPALAESLRSGTVNAARAAIASVPELDTCYEAYLQKFGERCVNELKLESATLHDDPLPLLRAVGHLARHAGSSSEGHQGQALRAQARERARAALARHPLRRLVFGWALRNARARVRDRENLRLERTRLFGRVRRIFIELGRRLHALDRLDDPRDVFYLEVDDVLAFVEGRATCTDLRSLARIRRAEFATYADAAPDHAPPDDRFETHGMVYQGHTFQRAAVAAGTTASPSASSRSEASLSGAAPSGAALSGAALSGAALSGTPSGAALSDASARAATPAAGSMTGAPRGAEAGVRGAVGTRAEADAEPDARQGLGCCPGVVRGPVRIVLDPHAVSLDRRGILVAEHTDPGWIMIFPSATGLLVERGSLLSHAAIVARELGIPAIVSVPGVTRWLRDGDWVEMDGATGRVRRVTPDAVAATSPSPSLGAAGDAATETHAQ